MTKVPGLNPAIANREEQVRAKTAGSLRRFERAQRSLSGGVSTALRRSARPHPLYFESGHGSKIDDVDGNRYLDYALAWGPLILGHSPQAINEAIAAQLGRGHTFGAQHDLEVEVAELLTSCIPCAETVAFANSGTEIVQIALRLARGVTGRSKFVKFEGHYHGWDDSVLVSYRPSQAAIDGSQGNPIPVGLGQRQNRDAIVVQWNDREGVVLAFEQNGNEIAALLCEPLLCNSGCLLPEPGFLEFLREITLRYGSLLIFDEVITGFRLALGGAQSQLGVTPDLATYAKAVGGGLPLSVLAGQNKYMEKIARGEVVHAGTLNGNPISLAAAKATISTLASNGGALYTQLWSLGEKLRRGIAEILRKRGFDVVTSGGGPVFHVSFMDRPARNYRETLAANTQLYSDFALALLNEGDLVLPDGRWYLSTAHTEEDIDETLAVVARAIA